MDECAEGGPQIHPTLTLHALQRFPHRLPADPELGGQLVFDEVLARLQLARDDHLDEDVVHRLAQWRWTFQWGPDGPAGRTVPQAPGGAP